MGNMTTQKQPLRSDELLKNYDLLEYLEMGLLMDINPEITISVNASLKPTWYDEFEGRFHEN